MAVENAEEMIVGTGSERRVDAETVLIGLVQRVRVVSPLREVGVLQFVVLRGDPDSARSLRRQELRGNPGKPGDAQFRGDMVDLVSDFGFRRRQAGREDRQVGRPCIIGCACLRRRRRLLLFLLDASGCTNLANTCSRVDATHYSKIFMEISPNSNWIIIIIKKS
uniref:Uncharacterized protein MANES_16G111900 n=1 Tax=Rhizophora mucronata TaxID=61149 RepID=A0A2P2LHT8_RHIMU